MSTPAENAATVREALNRHSEWDGLAALDALEAQAETNAGAQHVRESLIAEADAQRERAEEAEAELVDVETDRRYQQDRARAAEDERDKAKVLLAGELEARRRQFDQIDRLREAELRLCKTIVVKGNEVHRLAARVEKLEAALDKIEANPENPLEVQAIARTALDKDTG